MQESDSTYDASDRFFAKNAGSVEEERRDGLDSFLDLFAMILLGCSSKPASLEATQIFNLNQRSRLACNHYIRVFWFSDSVLPQD
jgi:hypothetical protein